MKFCKNLFLRSLTFAAAAGLSIPITAADLPVVSPGPLPNGYLNVYYSYRLSASGGAGSSYAWALVSGLLSPGLTLDTTGLISGTPTTTTGSPFSFSVTSTDVAGTSMPQTLSIDVAATGAAPAIASISPHMVPVGSPGVVVTISGVGLLPAQLRFGISRPRWSPPM
jgi:hypothetical protein